MKPLIFALLLAVSLVSGCASRASIGSFAGPLPEQNAVSAIAADAVSILSGLYPPGHTGLHVLPAKNAGNGFALALDNELRARGFALAAERADAVTVAYTLDCLDAKAAWYLRLRITDGKEARILARAYDALGRPEAGQSRAMQDAAQSVLGKAADAARGKAGSVYDAAHDFVTR